MKNEITLEKLEAHLDMLARIMDRDSQNARNYVPIWRALEREIAALRDIDRIMRLARASVKRQAQSGRYTKRAT